MKVLLLGKKTKKLAAQLPLGARFGRSDNAEGGMDMYMDAKDNNKPYDYVVSGMQSCIKRFRDIEERMNGKLDVPAKIVYAGHKNGFRSILDAYEHGASAFVGPNITRDALLQGFEMCELDS